MADTAPPTDYASQPLPLVSRGQSIKADHINQLSKRLSRMVPGIGAPYTPFTQRSVPSLFIATEDKPIDIGVAGDSTILVSPINDTKADRSNANEHDSDLLVPMRVRKRAYSSIKKWDIGILTDCGQDMPIFEPIGRPDLIFRQEDSDLPADGEFFPAFIADRDFTILGLTTRHSSGTYSMELRAVAKTGTIIKAFTQADQNTFLELTPIGFEIYEGESVFLKIVTSSSVEDFQLYVKTL